MVSEFEDGQVAYGFEGLCVRAVKTEEGYTRLTLLSSDAKGKVSQQVVLMVHCAEVNLRARQPRPLFSFKQQSFETKLRILGRCGVTDVTTSAPVEQVRNKFKPEGGHLQLWMTLLEQVFPEFTGYNILILELLLSEEKVNEEMRRKLEAEIQASVRTPGRHVFPIHWPQQD